MLMYKSLSLDKRNDVLKCLYVHSLSCAEAESLRGCAGWFTIDAEQFSSQLLVTANCLSTDEAGTEVVRC